MSRGLTYVVPVKDAFSYLLSATAGEAQSPAQQPALRDRVIAGETVPVTLRSRRTAVSIPADARPGQRIWQQLDGQWFDFTVVPLAEVEPSLEGNNLSLRLRSNLAQKATYRVEVLGQEQRCGTDAG